MTSPSGRCRTRERARTCIGIRVSRCTATVDPIDGAEAQWPGEAKIAGRAIADGSDGDRFHTDIGEVVHTHLNDRATLLVVEWWTPAHGLRRIERE
ncbi:MAG TPA: hypothetical protein VGH43_14935 [Jatrophihabitans sp.]